MIFATKQEADKYIQTISLRTKYPFRQISGRGGSTKDQIVYCAYNKPTKYPAYLGPTIVLALCHTNKFIVYGIGWRYNE